MKRLDKAVMNILHLRVCRTERDVFPQTQIKPRLHIPDSVFPNIAAQGRCAQVGGRARGSCYGMPAQKKAYIYMLLMSKCHSTFGL
jgi:hypothetical protein